jgi:hypothetical protein
MKEVMMMMRRRSSSQGARRFVESSSSFPVEKSRRTEGEEVKRCRNDVEEGKKERR